MLVGGTVSSHKGVNLPGAVLPISAMTRKDHADLSFGIELGFDELTEGWFNAAYALTLDELRPVLAQARSGDGAVGTGRCAA